MQEIASKFPEWEKKSHADFFSFRAVKIYFAHAVHFETMGLFWFFDRYLESAKTCPPTRKKKKERKLSDPKPSSRDGNKLKYFVRAQPSSTEAATLSSPDSYDDQTQDRAEPDE